MEVCKPPAKRRKITPNTGHRPVTRASLARTQQDDSTLPAYTYRSLKEEDEIRILKVEKIGPNEWQYDIEHITLTDAPPFETVSYVWGPDTRRNILRLRDDRKICINDNLAKALPYLSAECKTGYLWIDQININQSSTQERNHQVKMMGDIYKKGERVIAWLGMGARPSKRLSALITVASYSLELRESIVLTKGKIMDQLLQCSPQDFAAILNLLESAWFSRAWVFQEIVLSKHATFLFGGLAIPFLALVWLSKAPFVPKTPDVAPLPRTISSKLAQSSSQNTSYHDFVSRPGSRTLSIMHRSWHNISHTRDEDDLPFVWTLSKLSPMLQTTDPRDSVYAFLGLQKINDDAAPIETDYNSTYEETLINTAKSIIRSTRSLNLLSYCGRERNGQLLSRNLPSWVPEWRASVSTPLLALSFAGSFLSSQDHHIWAHSQDQSELRVRGVRFDTIDRCFAPEFRFRSASWHDENLKDYLSLNQRLESIKENTACSRERLLSVLLTRSYRPDVEYKHHHGLSGSTEDLLDAYDEYVENLGKSLVVENIQHLHALRFQTYLINTRQLFLTEGGHLGHVNQPSKGDIICTLEGCSHMVTLRPCGNHRFTVVGISSVEKELWDINRLNLPYCDRQNSTWVKHEGEEFILI